MVKAITDRITELTARCEAQIKEETGMVGRVNFVHALSHIKEPLLKTRQLVLSALEISESEIMCRNRREHVVFARKLIIYITKQLYPQVTWLDAAKLAGLTDHTSGIHNYRSAKELFETRHPIFLEMHEKIIEQLNNSHNGEHTEHHH